MRDFLQSQEKDMLALLEQLVNIDSGSSNKNGVDRVGGTLKAEYEKLGFNVQVVEQEVQGNHLFIQHPNAKAPEIILLAHMDTVFKEGTASERPFSIRGDRAYGPGVIDMKGSQVALLFAMKTLVETNQTGFENVCIVLNSDEEIGSGTSRALIEEKAVDKKFALVMEPARKDGSLVSARRGGGTYEITVQGKGAHSGIEPQNGISAIEELAHKIIKLHALTDHSERVSVNVGLIEGGESTNTVAPTAKAKVDVRISLMEQAEELSRKIEEICSAPDLPGTSIQLTGGIDRPPMVKNEKTVELLGIIQEIGEKLGIVIKDTATGGGSDATFTSAIGVPTIDGLGPIGGNAHSEEEYLEIPSFVERTHLLAELIVHLSNK